MTPLPAILHALREAARSGDVAALRLQLDAARLEHPAASAAWDEYTALVRSFQLARLRTALDAALASPSA